MERRLSVLTRSWLRRSLMFCLVGVCVFGLTGLGYSQDPGIPDTVRFEKVGSYIFGPPYHGKAVISVILENDEYLVGFYFPLRWTGSALLDTVSLESSRVIQPHYYAVTIDNVSKTLVCVAVRYGGVLIEPGRGPVVKLIFNATDTGMVTIDSTRIHGIGLILEDTYAWSWYPQIEKGVFELEPIDSLPGDVNLNGSVGLSDAIYLANYLLKSGREPIFLPHCDVNVDCLISIVDVVYLAIYVLKNGPVPIPGCIF